MEDESEQSFCHLGFFRRVYINRGFIFAFAAATLYALTAITVSALSNDISSVMTVFVRQLITLFLTSIVLCYKGIPILPSSRKEFLFLCVNSVLTLFTMSTQYYAYHHMPPADACAIINSYVVFAGLFGRLFLKEAFGFFEALMVLFTIMGVVLLSRPQFIFGLSTDLDEKDGNEGGFAPPLVALVCAISMALFLVVQRSMGKQNIHAMKVTFYNSVLSCLLLVAPITLVEQWTLPGTCIARSLVVILSFFAFSAYVLVYLATSIENIVYVSLILLNDVYLVFILGAVFFGYKPHWLTIIGIALIAGSSVVLSIKKIVYYMKENKKDKEKNHDEKVKEPGCRNLAESHYHLLGKSTSV